MRRLSVTILGSGCSTGVPRIDGYWGACDPANPKNRRSRCSAWFAAYDGDSPPTSLLVDTSPDLRTQALGAGIPHLDAVLWTHDHADQTHGIDDLRAFTFARSAPLKGYFDEATRQTLMSRFDYIFQGRHLYPPLCEPHLIPPHGETWCVDGPGGEVPIRTFDQVHGLIRSVGYRVGDIAYSSDISDLPESSFDAVTGLKLWIVDALRLKPHPTHSHLDKTLEWIEKFKPERAILTNLHQDLDYADLARQLPDHIEPAYDQMRVTVAL